MDFMEIKRNVNKQGTKILHDIAYAYESGLFDDPQSANAFAQLLACICEGKVEGVMDEDQAIIKWSLTKEYAEKMEKFQESLLASLSEEAGSNVIKGPWS